MPTSRLSHYTLLDPLGEGGMGAVYRARDERLGRTLAIKTLRAEGAASAELRQRLLQEAQAASALNHPNIVTVYDIGREEGAGLDFIAMEYIDGEPLAEAIRRGERGVDLALAVGIPVASALAAAHGIGIVHRDLKPANVMRTTSGTIKLLDFGLAKLNQPRSAGSDDATTPNAQLTTEGMVVGTPAYMAPEQAEGRAVDARSDVFALGVLLYEMLAGEHPFRAGSTMALMSAILRDTAQPVAGRCPGCPAPLARLVARCMEKDPARRPQHAGEVLAELERIRDDWNRRGTLAWRIRQARVLVPAALLLLALLGWLGHGAWQARQAEAMLAEGLLQIEALAEEEHVVEAYALLRALEPRFAGSEALARWRADLTLVADLATEPPGARMAIQPYRRPDAPWVDLGLSDQAAVPMPREQIRWRIEKDGYRPLELVTIGDLPFAALTPLGEAPEGMLRVPGGPFRYGSGRNSLLPLELDDFWLGRTEVTNAEYLRFVEAGGYRRPEFWQQPMPGEGRELGFEEAMALFVDATGRPGPAGWELSHYPDGRGQHPVAGISWFEAMAYARFAGKQLPSAHHWMRAAGHDIHSNILRFANFESGESRPVASSHAISPFGHHDLAGNVAEWVANADEARALALGGHFAAGSYLFSDLFPESKWTRSPNLGFRLALLDAPLGDSISAMPHGDDANFGEPVSDEVFAALLRFYAVDPSDDPGELESIEETEHWRTETWSLPAAYADERFRVRLYLPRRGSPPFQTILYAPTSVAVLQSDSSLAGTREFAFLIRSGRAVAAPVFYNTYERRLPADAPPQARRAVRPNWTRDAARVIDLIERHPELDGDAVGFLGFSLGANAGMSMLAVEPRFRAAVFLATGLFATPLPAETDPVNFLPRIRQPLLLVGGSHDFMNPVETSQRPLYERIGTAPELKRHFIFDGGHVPPRPQEVMGEMLDWFDRHLGPVD
jgi:eukaryotic-like serine/threonine-protein kinase